MHFCTLCIWRTLMCVRVCHAGLKSFNKKRYFKANVGAQWKNLQGTDSVGKFKWGQRLAIKSVVQNSIWRRSVLMCLRRRLVSSRLLTLRMRRTYLIPMFQPASLGPIFWKSDLSRRSLKLALGDIIKGFHLEQALFG